MSENKCEMCFKAEPTTEIGDGNYMQRVCSSCKDKYDQEQVYKRIQPLVEALCKELNSTGSKRRVAQALFTAFTREHRYLQSEVFQVLWLFFEKYGKQPEGHYDDRNAGAVKWAKKWYEST